MPTRLTAQVKAGGCASRLSPKILDRVLARLPRASHPSVLVGFETADDAGVYCAILGGHSVAHPDIKFGYAVTVTVHPDRVWINAGARPGDVLVLTRRIGTGVISTALKRGLADARQVEAATESMLTLNPRAAEALAGLEVHAVTDVTGFGLLGHSREMALASRVTLVIEAAAVPLFDGAIDYARAGAIPGGTHNNREFVASRVAGTSALDDLLYDPQTSGGLLISMPSADASVFLERFPSASVLGRVDERGEKPILIQ